MESLDETSKSLSSKMGFFKHVFNFDDNSKSEILNIIQYSILAIIPIVSLNKLSQKYVPEADEEKGNLEILAEIILQVLVIFLGLLLVNRIITYVPTYSGTKYPDFSVIYIILAVLMITLSLQTKLGEKVSILVDRLNDLWEGGRDDKDAKKKKKKSGSGGGGGTVKTSQPISQNAAITQSLYSGGGGGDSQSTPIHQLPTLAEQPSQDYNSMYQNQNTQLVGAASPGGGIEGFVPMAANESLGGSFGSAFGGGF